MFFPSEWYAAEIRIDLSEGKVIEILDMPENVRYSGIPVAI